MDVMLKNNSKTEMVSLFGRSIAPGKTFPVEKRLIGHVAVRRLLDSGVLVYPKADKPETVKVPEAAKPPVTPVVEAEKVSVPEVPAEPEKAPEVPAETVKAPETPAEEEKAPEDDPKTEGEKAKKSKKKK